MTEPFVELSLLKLIYRSGDIRPDLRISGHNQWYYERNGLLEKLGWVCGEGVEKLLYYISDSISLWKDICDFHKEFMF